MKNGNNGGIIKKRINADKGLQKQLPYIRNGKKEFIPTNAKFSSKPKTIAGEGTETKIRQIKSVVNKYGGKEEDWAKKVVKIESSKYIFDVHWYQKDNIQYEMKLKERSEKK